MAELEARLADMSECLQDAEQRAGELLVVRARTELLEQTFAVIVASRSWRFTRPLRRVMAGVRALLPR
ncbi:MAG: hypothetical protein ABSH51_03385 [Solirubrobacteraceae bacterium]